VPPFPDPRVKDWFFMGSPLAVLVLVVVYNITVLYLGPKFMAKRKAFELKTAIILYNLAQILLNSYFLIEVS
jgi:GNS1/SUR4 family.